MEAAVSQVAGLDEPLLVNVTQVARLLGLSERTVWQLDKGGKLPLPLRIGRSVRWHLEELRRWVSAGSPPRAKWQLQQQGRR